MYSFKVTSDSLATEKVKKKKPTKSPHIAKTPVLVIQLLPIFILTEDYGS